MTEDQLEQEALGWLSEVGYQVLSGYDLAPDGSAPERRITARCCWLSDFVVPLGG